MNESRQLPPSFTPPEIARAFRVDVKVVRQWIASGRIRAMNIASNGRPKYRVTQKSLQAFTDSLEREHQASVAGTVGSRRRVRAARKVPNHLDS